MALRDGLTICAWARSASGPTGTAGTGVECVVTSEPDEERGERIIGFVAQAGGGSLAQLTAYYCKTEFCRYMQPPHGGTGCRN